LKPYKHDHLFFGRQDVFDTLREKLSDGEMQHILVLYGRRRTGKTSLLLRLPKQLSDSHIVVYLDIQSTEILSGTPQHLEYITNIISKTVSEALPKGAAFCAPTREDYERNPTHYFQQVFLPGLIGAIGQRKLLLVFDEFQAFEDKISRGELNAGFLPFMRNWVQFSDQIDFIFAGSKTLEELNKNLWGVLFNLSVVHELELLKPSESRDLMVKPLAPVGGTYDEPALDRLDWFTGRHPYFIQLLCSKVVEELNRREQKIVSVAVVDAAAQELIDNAAPQLRFLWDELNEKQQAVAASIQKRLQEQPDQLHSHLDDVWEWMANVNPNVSKDDFRRVIHDLSRKALITESDGNLRFTMGLLQDYLAQYVSISETKGRIYKQW
jgi:AAA+ ATPase superfamily predicted ATPase